MNLTKIILAIAGLVLVALIIFLAIGLLLNLIWYAFLLAALYIVGLIAVKMLKKPASDHQLDQGKTARQLANADELLQDYKRQLKVEKNKVS